MSATAWIILSVFFGGLVTGVPVAFAIGLSAAVGLYVADFPFVVLAQRVLAGTQVFSLLAIPGFVLAGELMMAGGLSRRLVKVGQALVQHITGGLGMVTVVSATFFAAISGSAPATTAAIGGIMIPEMEKRGWRRDFSTSLATASGPIGQMIPPSIPMIIWGVIAEESISQLFLAGIIPGLLIAVGLMIWCWTVARREGINTDARRSTASELGRAVWEGKWSLAAPLVILGGIYGGVFTPTEASAIGVAYALIVGVGIHREIKFRDLGPIMVKSMRTATIVCFIIAVASAFGWLIAIEQIPGTIASGILSVSDNPVVILLLLNLALLFIGAVMDNVAAMIILGAILTSIGQSIGLDPIHLGAIVVINLAIGMATPPFGYSLFVGSAVSGVPIEKLVRTLWPMLAIMLVVLLLVTYVPAVTLALPSLIR
ncbi:C4-dicarboxylate transport system large permease [Roseivivax marinus]|uniref:TRAP transporter large permease protein n=1 Tax=Roseivivax marinus TaxID=1379903 RepID=W4HN02_9RHOB|nr:TRAP transporter large permease [Roseivivax marinus]ETW14094.1 C4-dicarboxylate transport system large permease [Roseivivax marinus]SEL75205.1 C4-dicarboxylate transporter, DctM subunit [Roseivivax marinus]